MTSRPRVIAGRHQADLRAEIIAFPIGMKINRLWAVHRWLRPMIDTVRLWRHVQTARPNGYLSGYLFAYSRGLGMMQYWQDFDSLEAFASDTTRPHLAAWRNLVAQTRTDQTFGYWHETYVIGPSTSETIYGSMAPFGLSAAVGQRPIGKEAEAARARLSGPD